MLIGVLYVLATVVVLLAMVDQTMVRRIEGWIERRFGPSFDTFEEWLKKEDTKK